MARTESKPMQVHPMEEQAAIETMRRFGWSLLSSQEVHLKDSHLENKLGLFGENLVSVTETTHYVKLAFSRDLDLANLDKLRELERQYYGLQPEAPPTGMPGWVWAIAVVSSFFLFGVPLIAAVVVHFAMIAPRKAEWEQQTAQRAEQRKAVVQQAMQY